MGTSSSLSNEHHVSEENGKPSPGDRVFLEDGVETKSPAIIRDHFIPEWFLDYSFIKKGKIKCVDNILGTQFTLPRQVFKTIHTRPLRFVFSTPLILFEARLSLKFVESFGEEIRANSFFAQTWVNKDTNDLEMFAFQITEYVQKHRTKKWPYPMLYPALQESGWLVNFSPRHKRRLYKATFGLSRKEIQNIHNLHSFLERTCDFASQNPRITST